MLKKDKISKFLFLFLSAVFIFGSPKNIFAEKSIHKEIPFKANFLSKNYKVRQGRTVRAQVKVNKRPAAVQVKFLSKVYNCLSNPKKPFIYECYIPIECEGKAGKIKLSARAKVKKSNWVYLKSLVDIKKVKFAKSVCFGYPKSKANLKLKNKAKKDKNSCKGGGFNRTMQRFLKKSPIKPMWVGAFGLPTKVNRYSTPFGEIRYSPNWGRYLHKAVDIVAPPRYPVWASHNGKVVMKCRYLYSGNTVVLDHGHGVFTYYFHLDSFGKIKVGDFVKKGKMIGRIGNTGRSTGFHLHWGLSINNEFVDPVEWTMKKFD